VSELLHSAFSVRVFRTVADLEQIRQQWDFWSGYRDSDLDFFNTVLSSSPEAVRPHVIAIYRGEALEAILVGRLDRRRMDCGVGYLRIRPRADILYFVYGGLRGNASPEVCEALVAEVQASLKRGEADVAYLNFLPEDSPLGRLARTAPNFVSRDHLRVSQPHFTALLPDSWSAFLAALSSNTRQQTKSKQKKFERAFPGTTSIRCFRSADEIARLVADVEKVAKASYQRGLAVGFADTVEIRERLQLMAAKDWLRGYVLYVADQPCAFWVGALHQATFSSDYLGYDSEYSKYSAGTYLVTKVIERFCGASDGQVKCVDFEPGYAQYKEGLSNQNWQELSTYIFAPSLKGIGLNLVRTMTVGMDQWLKNLLRRTSLLQKIKKQWRTYVADRSAKQRVAVAQ
jgi:CelD/BcsL family acetyltransferase involved in cellulose biosynthesis